MRFGAVSGRESVSMYRRRGRLGAVSRSCCRADAVTVRGSVADAVRQSVLEGVRPGSSGGSEIRILFAFDPVRRAVLLVAGDKAGNWQRWYDVNIPIAEERYRAHVTDLETREYE
ncbi:type II toxin-antitoxin system RelE/ParE family toxin [Streptomyces werraensis]|uniref:type II toxin-antitoxin system RelE/ParE family toxin n=1 Tax=Streptomyces werraensis TaxID=68284 RepID=UPI0037D5F3D8